MNTFWVIERFQNGKSQGYWNGNSSRDFDTNIEQAIQFRRKEDAQHIRRGWHWNDTQVTEHSYLACCDFSGKHWHDCPYTTPHESVYLVRNDLAAAADQMCKCPYAKDQSQQFHPVGSLGCKTALAGPQNGQGWVSIETPPSGKDEDYGCLAAAPGWTIWAEYEPETGKWLNATTRTEIHPRVWMEIPMYRLPAPPTGDAPHKEKP